MMKVSKTGIPHPTLVFPSWIPSITPLLLLVLSSFSLPLCPHLLVSDMLFTAWRMWHWREVGVMGQCHSASCPLTERKTIHWQTSASLHYLLQPHYYHVGR